MQLSEIKGIGEKRIAALNKSGIYTPEQLLLCYPYQYLDLSKPPNFLLLSDGDEIAFYGTVAEPPVTRYVRKGLFYTKTSFSPYYATHNNKNSLQISATFFNQRYIAKQLVVGKPFCISGKIKRFRDKIEIQAPVLTPYGEGKLQCIPLYKPPKGLPVAVLQEAIAQVLARTKIESRIPLRLGEQYGLIPLNQAIRMLHLPEKIEDANGAVRSLAIESLAGNLCTFHFLRKRGQFGRSRFYDASKLSDVKALVDTLPYRLTEGQQNALHRLLDGLNDRDKPLNALLAGDVGCGKTVVAFLLMYYAALSGYQSVLMVPTEILAAQHYRNALTLLGHTDVKICVLTSSQNAKFRSENLFHIKNGCAQIVIGTHAVIQKDVEFQNLALVIADEQHRFGVLQRGSLENKGVNTDSLVMSATPIPRTLALTLYGDLDAVEIRDKPPQKAHTVTRYVPAHKERDLYGYLLKKCEAGEQCFVVCPRIDEGEEDLPSVMEIYERLKPMFASHGIAALHGKLSEQEKSRIMEVFSKKECKILVTTTVIEVGIDYKDATSIVVYNAERYGLSQLHQLRGRVGRGDKESYCFILSDNGTAKERLDYFCATDSGFELAEYDFERRGAGDFLGTRQHGASAAKITPDMIKVAKSIADELCLLDEFQSGIRQAERASDYDFIKNLTLN